MILQRGVQHAALVRVHRLEHDLAAGLLRAVGHALRQAAQAVLALGAVVLGVQRHADVALAALVHLQAGQVLQRVQRLAAASDEDAQRVADHVDVQAVLGGIVHIDVHLHVHQAGHVHQEALRPAGRGVLRVHHRRLGRAERLRRHHRRVLARLGLLFGLGRLLGLGRARLLLARGLRLLRRGLGLRFRLHFCLDFGLGLRLHLSLRLGLGLHFRLRLGLDLGLHFRLDLGLLLGRLLCLRLLLRLRRGGLLRRLLARLIQAEGVEQVAQAVVVLLLLLHDGQADARRLAAEQAEQALGALLDHVDMHIGDGHAQRGEAGVNGFLGRLSGEFLTAHQMPTSSAVAALRSWALKYRSNAMFSTRA